MPASQSEHATRFDIDGVEFELDRNTLQVLSVSGPGGTWFEKQPEGSSLWRLHTVDREGIRVDLDGSTAKERDVRMEGKRLHLSWRGVSSEKEQAGPFDVDVTVEPYAGAGKAVAFHIDVRNQSKDWTLWHVNFPQLDGLKPAAEDDQNILYKPTGWGNAYQGWENMPELHRRYPQGWDWAMQFMCYTRGDQTLYFGVHDPSLRPKYFDFNKRKREDDTPYGRFAVQTYAEEMTRGGNGMQLSYDTVLGWIDGDWYDACQVYRGWVRDQSWAKRDPSAWTDRWRKVDAWMLVRVSDKSEASWKELLTQLNEELDMDMGVHFYQWHEVPFDTSYPEYFPVRPEFPGLIKHVHELGGLSMPYINGRLWDINSASWEAENAERSAVKHAAERLEPRTLAPYVEQYASKQMLSPMCISTDQWRQKVVDICRTISDKLGCGGVYIDQVAAAKAELCCNPEHGHPLGGGGWWHDGYRKMAAQIRQDLGQQFVMTSECNWEGCIADYEGLLMWNYVEEDQVPMFAAVYSGVVGTFGCRFDEAHITKEGGEPFARRMAWLLVWGAQLGWGDLTWLLGEDRRPVREFFNRLCRIRHDYTDTFLTGTMLRPPTLAPAKPVMASIWESREGKKTLFLVNPSREKVSLEINVPEGTAMRREMEGYGAVAVDLS